MTYRVVDANWDMLVPVLGDIRQADRDEWKAGTGQDFEIAVVPTFCDAPEGYLKAIVGSDNVPLCFWGVNPEGAIWMFATNRGQNEAYAMHRLMRGEWAKVRERWSRLHCWADARNTAHHEWMRWLGFRQTAKMFINKHPFLHFVIENNKEAQPCA